MSATYEQRWCEVCPACSDVETPEELDRAGWLDDLCPDCVLEAELVA